MQIVDITDCNSQPNTKQKDEIVVGIDFGTTNSLIAISENCNARIIAMENGQELLPSVIQIFDENLTVNHALCAQDLDSNKTIRSIKRLLAKSSSEVKNSVALKTLSHAINLDQQIPIINLINQNITIAEAASEIFKCLKRYAEQSIGSEITKAVVSIPAYFNDTERGQILLAAKLANLEILRLIAEPTAAAYAYGLNKKNHGTYIVYDLGGGTFDVSMLNMQKGVLQVIATDGDSMLGGDDIDMLLAEHIANLMECQINEDVILFAKQLKENLSSADNASLKFDQSDISLSRVQYNKIIAPVIDQTIVIVKNLLQEAKNINPTVMHDIAGIILVGGSTRIPLISEKLRDNFQFPLYNDLDPDKIVALGAAMQAENLSTKTNALLIDVVPLSVGLELYGGIVEKIIMRNTPIPFTATREFTTHIDNQTAIALHIVQGEREMVKDCRSLASFELQDIPPNSAGKARILVAFSMDSDGILSVSATEASTNKVQNLEIKPTYALTEEDINTALHDAFSNAKHDHEMRLMLETRENGNKLIVALQKALQETPDILSMQDYNALKNEILSLQKIINCDNREAILAQIQQVNKLANNFIQEHLNVGANLLIKGKNINDVL